MIAEDNLQNFIYFSNFHLFTFRFPELFDYINKNGLNEDIYFENEIFGEGK